MNKPGARYFSDDEYELRRGRVRDSMSHRGIDMNSIFLPYSIAEGIMQGLPDADWQDLESLVDDIRIVHSPGELALTRQAAAISDSMMLSAIAAAGWITTSAKSMPT